MMCYLQKDISVVVYIMLSLFSCWYVGKVYVWSMPCRKPYRLFNGGWEHGVWDMRFSCWYACLGIMCACWGVDCTAQGLRVRHTMLYAIPTNYRWMGAWYVRHNSRGTWECGRRVPAYLCGLPSCLYSLDYIHVDVYWLLFLCLEDLLVITVVFNWVL